jgi:hypothetical protein
MILALNVILLASYSCNQLCDANLVFNLTFLELGLLASLKLCISDQNCICIQVLKLDRFEVDQ